MNSMQVKDKLKNYSKSRNIEFNIALKNYVFERFIIRLSKSKYVDNFILKGGFLLSTLFGLENRDTMDIDSSVKDTKFTKDNLTNILNEILSIDLNDNICFKITDVCDIRNDDIYGGFRFFIRFKFENIIENFRLDVATGDPITPSAIRRKYKLMLDDLDVSVWTYNLETVLVEKLESILSKLEMSSRMKDYYDIYYIVNYMMELVDIDILRKAAVITFKKRNFEYDSKMFDIIQNSFNLRNKWLFYSRKYKYANNIKYDDVINSIRLLIEYLY